jgi:hypothetical protein
MIVWKMRLKISGLTSQHSAIGQMTPNQFEMQFDN